MYKPGHYHYRLNARLRNPTHQVVIMAVRKRKKLDNHSAYTSLTTGFSLDKCYILRMEYQGTSSPFIFVHLFLIIFSNENFRRLSSHRLYVTRLAFTYSSRGQQTIRLWARCDGSIQRQRFMHSRLSTSN